MSIDSLQQIEAMFGMLQSRRRVSQQSGLSSSNYFVRSEPIVSARFVSSKLLLLVFLVSFFNLKSNSAESILSAEQFGKYRK